LGIENSLMMPTNNFANLESLWDALLSRQPDQVRSAFKRLEPSQQEAVLTHLQRMATEPSWHPEQCKAARAALEALQY
jgi:hypothetical protein